MLIRHKLRAVAVGASILMGLVIGAGPAQAATSSTLYICSLETSTACYDYVSGTVTWYNRTALLTGAIAGDHPNIIATFEAWAGSTRVGAPQTRTSYDYGRKGFEFTMGDSNLPGGINTIYYKLCHSSGSVCSAWHSVYK
jgi:hypothetical protein